MGLLSKLPLDKMKWLYNLSGMRLRYEGTLGRPNVLMPMQREYNRI